MVKYLAMILLVGASVLAFAQSKPAEKPVWLFAVNQSPTFTDEFIYLYSKNPNPKREEASVNEYLDLLIRFKLKIAEAKARGLDTTAKFQKEFKTYREELKRPYRAGEDALTRLTKEAYDHMKEEIRASHILVLLKEKDTPADTLKAFEKIKSLRERAVKGEDFAKLAQEFSEDPSAKYNQGDLGYFTAMQMVYPFEIAAYALKPGEVSPIVRTRFGYHIIQLKDRRPSRGEVEVRHILLRKGQGDESKIKDKIFDIYDQLKSGRPWDELCKEFSEDVNTKDTGGKLNPFGVGAFSAIPEFEGASFLLQNPGDISDPFQSAMGWHLVKLEKKIPLPPYSELESSLKRKVARDERVQLSEKKLSENRKKEFGFISNEEARRKILSLADSTLTQGKWSYMGLATEGEQPLFSIKDHPIKVSEFARYIRAHQTKSYLTPTQYADQLYSEFVEEKLSEEEEKLLAVSKPEFRNLLTEYKEGILLFDIMEKEVWNKASEDTLGQRKFYNEHQLQYKAGNRVEASIMATQDKSYLEEIKKKITRGDTLKPEDLKKFKSIQNFRTYEKGESKIIDKINWVVGLHETELDGTYYLVEVRSLVAPGTKSLAEAKASVISDFQDSLEKNWVAQLKQKYPVKVNKKGKKAVLKALLSQ